MVRILSAAAVVFMVAAFGATGLHADEFEEEQARTIEGLHAFGVRGLPGAYAQSHESVARARAIERGLAWLAAHQTPDGSWRPAQLYWCNGKKQEQGAPSGKGKDLYETGITGMVVTAFLGAGYTHRGKHPYAKVVRDAITWLVDKQDDEGCVGPRRTQQYIYNHAFGTLALVEAYALTGDAKLRQPAQDAIDFSALARNPYLAWRYGVKPGDNDTSVTGCMGLPLYVALRLNRAGERAHVFEPLGLDDTIFDGIRNWLDKVVDPDTGQAGYVFRGMGSARPQDLIDEFPGDKSEACTAISLFLRLVLPAPSETRKEAAESKKLTEKGVQLLLNLKPAWTIRAGNIDLYYWYYATMALRQIGGEAWSAWDEALAEALLNSQHKDGDVCGVKGSWDPAGVWAKADGGRIYATALCVLMLETPDRMRPLPEQRTDLIDALNTQGVEPQRRATILRGLGLLGVPKAGGEVAKWVGDDDERVCAAAAEALGRLDAGAKGVKVLAKLLDDKRVTVRRAAVGALAAQGPHLRPVIDQLLKRMGDEDLEVAAGAARALGQSQVPDVAGVLKPRMKEGDIALRVAAAAAVFNLTKDAGTLPVLVEGLKAKSARVRLEAVEAIESMEGADLSSAETALRAALTDGSFSVRVHAAGALLFTAGKQELRPDCLQAWITSLDSRRGQDRANAMTRLALLGDSRPTRKLAAQLLTGPTSLRIQAANTLAAAGKGARAAAATLSWCSVNGPSALRKAASDAYDRLEVGPAEAIKILLPLFDDPADADRRDLEGAARALVFQGGAVVSALTDVLATGERGTKSWMLDILRRLGRASAPAVPVIARTLDGTKDVGLKVRCARTLKAIGPGAVKALSALEGALNHEADWLRTEALEAIGALAPGSAEAAKLLVGVARDPDPKRRGMRLAALRALGGLEDHADRVLPPLLMTLEDANAGVREAAIDALAELWPASESYLEQALTQAGPKVRNGAARVVARVGAPAKKLVKPLAKILGDGNFSSETPYADALGAIGKPSVRALKKLLRSPTPSVRGEAARALGLIGPDAKAAVGSLRKLLSDADWGVRTKAQEAIDKIKPPKKR